VRLRYTLRGAAELDKTLATIAEHSPHGAHRVPMRIRAVIDLLLQHPRAGRLTSKGDLRRVVPIPTRI